MGAKVITAGSDVATAVLGGKGGEDCGGFPVIQEYWFKGHVGTEGVTDCPVVIGGGGY